MRRSEIDRSEGLFSQVAGSSETICALATAHGIGAISVIRISGSRAIDIVRKLADFLPENLESHKIYYGIMTSLDGARKLDEVLISYFQKGRSFTGETTFEISCHGSETIVNEILQELVSAGARSARRGEFTFRAFMNGRLDLVQAESVLAMIESRSSRASQLALRQLQGGFSKKLKSLLDDLVWVLANLEANIDYAAEDIEIASADALVARLDKLKTEIERLLSTYRQGRIVREGFQIALVGKPNAGKSSLLNALAGEDRAIVTEVAGTTRDFVEAELLINGYRVTLVDTAGLRSTNDRVEKIGVDRTLGKLGSVDLVFYIADASEQAWDEQDEHFLSQVPLEKTVLIWNKMDLVSDVPHSRHIPAVSTILASASSGRGLSEIRDFLARELSKEISEDSTLVANIRHFEGLKVVRNAVAEAIPLVLSGESPDLIALELQAGVVALYEILGLTYDDQVMDRVFQEFCLGK